MMDWMTAGNVTQERKIEKEEMSKNEKVRKMVDWLKLIYSIEVKEAEKVENVTQSNYSWRDGVELRLSKWALCIWH